jgi:pimeloyl-ACP methyl ester carboxylesterase
LNTWALTHGFNRNPNLFAGLVHDLGAVGLTPIVVDYGHQLTLSTDKAVKSILEHCPPGSNIIAHSNGAVAAVTAAIEHGLWIRNLIMVQPPLARDIRIPPTIGRCVCIWNRGDNVVVWSSRYNKIVDALMSWRRVSHGYYGDMGKRGPKDSRVESVEVSRHYGHAGIFERPDSRRIIVELAVNEISAF